MPQQLSWLACMGMLWVECYVRDHFSHVGNLRVIQLGLILIIPKPKVIPSQEPTDYSREGGPTLMMVS